MIAREITEAQGTWQDLYADPRRLFESGRPAEYLVVIGRKPA